MTPGTLVSYRNSNDIVRFVIAGNCYLHYSGALNPPMFLFCYAFNTDTLVWSKNVWNIMS